MKEVDFKDRVPTNPGRVILTPVTGQANTYTMQRADAPTETGTPIDKATFNSIIHSRLTGRYYPLTVAKTTVTTRTVTASPLPLTGWALTAGNVTAQNGEYSITASSAIGADYNATLAVDGNEETNWGSTDGLTHTFTVKLPSAIEVKKITFSLGKTGDSSFVTKFQGSTDGNVWTDLYTLSAFPYTSAEYTLTKTGDFQWYRLHFTRGSSSRCYINELAFTEYVINTYRNTFTTEGLPAKWDNGQRVTVQTPDFQTYAVQSNTVAGIQCNTILLPNRKYELIYDSSRFNAKEV